VCTSTARMTAGRDHRPEWSQVQRPRVIGRVPRLYGLSVSTGKHQARISARMAPSPGRPSGTEEPRPSAARCCGAFSRHPFSASCTVRRGFFLGGPPCCCSTGCSKI
jgi:hypothetical protein